MQSKLLTFVIHIYSALFKLTLSIARLIPGRRMARLHLRERLDVIPAHRDFHGRTVVWLHAASLGEAKVLIEFLSLLHAKHPGDLYVLTATSETGVQFLEQCRHEAVCATGYFPCDSISCMEVMMARFSIARVWLIETELWPSMLWVCATLGVPVGIANARLEEKALVQYCRFSFVMRPLLRSLAIVLVQDEQYARRFEALGVERSRITVIGNIKSRVLVKRPALDIWLQNRKAMHLGESDIVITVGCAHRGEGEALGRAIASVRRDYPRWKWIVVPRYLDDTDGLVEALGPDTVATKSASIDTEWPVCVVGAFGVLNTLYCIADAAVVGGTFVDVGGHNVWEAAQFGIPVLWGPYFHTQRESCERLLKAGVGFTAENGDELGAMLIRVFKTDARKFIEAQHAFITACAENARSLEHAIP